MGGVVSRKGFLQGLRTVQPPGRPVPSSAEREAGIEARRAGGRKGGLVRARKLTARQRSAVARKGARKRWGK